MISNPKVTINQQNLDLNVSWSSSPNKTFGNLSLLNISGKESPDFATLELNEYLLGSQFGKNIKNISFMSSGLSDEECEFANTWVEGNLGGENSFYISTVEFGASYPKKVSIQHFLDDEMLDEEIIDNIDSKVIFTTRPFVNINKVKIIFLESWAPYSYAHLQSWKMGGNIVFTGEDINELKLSENTDPISNRLEIDTAHIEILDLNNNFNLLEKKNVNMFVSTGGEVNISVNIVENDIEQEIFLGRYYIKNVSFGTNHSLILDCESFLGIMDKIPFSESDMLYDLNQGNLPTLKESIDRIFEKVLSSLNIPQNKWSEYYELDDGFDSILDYGYIPPQTCRSALQQVCFAHNLTVFDNRNTKILIKNNNLNGTVNQISVDRVVSQPSFELLDTISTATINVHSYSQGEEQKILDIDAPGEYLFDGPTYVTSVNVIEGTAPQVSYNINGISINSDGSHFKLEVYGQKFKDAPYDYLIKTNIQNGKDTKLSDSKSIIKYNADSVIKNATSFFNKYCLKLKIQYINKNEGTGSKLSLDLVNKIFNGILVYQSLDVAHGMVADAEILGTDQSQ